MNKSNLVCDTLLSRFNKRDESAFSEVYINFYDDLFYFTSKLFHHTLVVAEDVIHDVFLAIWKSDVKFDSIEHLKGYSYLSIRNRYKNTLQHKEYCDKYELHIKCSEDYQYSLIMAAESLSILDTINELLPKECAKVLQLYLEGWSAEEIAIRLNKSVNTVYSQKQTAIKVLRKRLSKSSLYVCKFFLNSL